MKQTDLSLAELTRFAKLLIHQTAFNFNYYGGWQIDTALVASPSELQAPGCYIIEETSENSILIKFCGFDKKHIDPDNEDSESQQKENLARTNEALLRALQQSIDQLNDASMHSGDGFEALSNIDISIVAVDENSASYKAGVIFTIALRIKK